MLYCTMPMIALFSLFFFVLFVPSWFILFNHKGQGEKGKLLPCRSISSKGACLIVRPGVRDIALLQSETLPTKGTRTQHNRTSARPIFTPAFCNYNVVRIGTSILPLRKDFIMSNTEFSSLAQGIIDGELDTVLDEVQRCLAENVSPQSIMDGHLVPAMSEVGRLFEEGEYFVPELMISARAMQAAMKILNPLLTGSGVQKIGRVVIGTVKGDFHDIGKNLVAAMLEGGGFDVVDLGVDVSPEQFAEAAQKQTGTLVAMSALLTTTMPQMKAVINKLEEVGLRSTSKVIVGGAPVTDEFARQIGADGYSDNASAAVTLAKSLLWSA